MDAEMRSRVNAAKHLADEIGRIGALEGQRTQRGTGMSFDNREDARSEISLSQGGALPVSPPNSLASKLRQVIVADAAAKDDLCELVDLR